jgi:hypothetical protein
MSIFETINPSQPTANQGALRVKRALAQVFQQVELALDQVRQIIARHGANEIEAALGADRDEVSELYQALQSLIEEHKPGTVIPDMPTSTSPN